MTNFNKKINYFKIRLFMGLKQPLAKGKQEFFCKETMKTSGIASGSRDISKFVYMSQKIT